MKQRAKAIVAGIAIIVNVLNAAFSDNVFDMTEKQQIVSTVITVAIGIYYVWRVPNAKDTNDA